MAAYVNHIIETAQRLRGTGFNIDEEWIGSLLLAEEVSTSVGAGEASGTNEHSPDTSVQDKSELESEKSFEDYEGGSRDSSKDSDTEYVPTSKMVEQRVPEPWSSKRQPKPNVLEDYVTYLYVEDQGLGDPATVEEAMTRPDAKMWKEAMQDEIQSFEEDETWEMSEWSADSSVVKNKWVFKKKVNCEGEARLNQLMLECFEESDREPEIQYDDEEESGEEDHVERQDLDSDTDQEISDVEQEEEEEEDDDDNLEMQPTFVGGEGS
ncbi:glutamic acid-rich protein-like [Anthonomus grandis grandis]|uniref:glutamic acid-rich protein-like n=1 Tax=Anthonomus grandis grandis TaxID=2921223 RepID=UPI002166BCE1|nr:glutamic acid-rich protein-like [Anthonomus grandis grandis]